MEDRFVTLKELGILKTKGDRVGLYLGEDNPQVHNGTITEVDNVTPFGVQYKVLWDNVTDPETWFEARELTEPR